MLLRSKCDWLTKSLWSCHTCAPMCGGAAVCAAIFTTDVFLLYTICLWRALDLTHLSLLFTHRQEHLHLTLWVDSDLNPDSTVLCVGRKAQRDYICLWQVVLPSLCALIAITGASIYSSVRIRSLVQTLSCNQRSAKGTTVSKNPMLICGIPQSFLRKTLTSRVYEEVLDYAQH